MISSHECITRLPNGSVSKAGANKLSGSAGLQADQKGVLIRRIEPTAPVSKSLNKGDILLSFDGVDIANDGTVPFRSGERISFNYLVSRKYTNEEVTPPLCVNFFNAAD